MSKAAPWFSWVGCMGKANVITAMDVRPGSDRWFKDLDLELQY